MTHEDALLLITTIKEAVLVILAGLSVIAALYAMYTDR